MQKIHTVDIPAATQQTGPRVLLQNILHAFKNKLCAEDLFDLLHNENICRKYSMPVDMQPRTCQMVEINLIMGLFVCLFFVPFLPTCLVH